MANDLTVNPNYIDTAEALYTGLVRPKAIAWVATADDALVATDDFLLSKASGAKVVEKRAAFDGDGIEMWHFPEGFSCTGLTLTTLDGGICYLWF